MRRLIVRLLALTTAVLVASRLFFALSPTDFVVTAAALVSALACGVMLIFAVDDESAERRHARRWFEELSKHKARVREVEQRSAETLSTLTKELSAPITEAEKSLSLLTEGAFGPLTPAAGEAARQALEETRKAAALVRGRGA